MLIITSLICVCVFMCSVHAAVQSVNASLRLSDPRHTVSCLMASDLQLPQVFPFAAALYHRELQLLQRRAPQVRPPSAGRTHCHACSAHPLTNAVSSSPPPSGGAAAGGAICCRGDAVGRCSYQSGDGGRTPAAVRFPVDQLVGRAL